MWRECWYANRGSVKYELKCLKRGDMSTANDVFKINEVAKEFGFNLKDQRKTKNYKIVCLFLCKSSFSGCISSFSLFSTSTTSSVLRLEQQE